jgi:hypothetical protein
MIKLACPWATFESAKELDASAGLDSTRGGIPTDVTLAARRFGLLLSDGGRLSEPLPFTRSLVPQSSQNFELSEHSFPQDWHRIIS